MPAPGDVRKVCDGAPGGATAQRVHLRKHRGQRRRSHGDAERIGDPRYGPGHAGHGDPMGMGRHGEDMGKTWGRHEEDGKSMEFPRKVHGKSTGDRLKDVRRC